MELNVKRITKQGVIKYLLSLGLTPIESTWTKEKEYESGSFHSVGGYCHSFTIETKEEITVGGNKRYDESEWDIDIRIDTFDAFKYYLNNPLMEDSYYVNIRPPRMGSILKYNTKATALQAFKIKEAIDKIMNEEVL